MYISSNGKEVVNKSKIYSQTLMDNLEVENFCRPEEYFAFSRRKSFFVAREMYIPSLETYIPSLGIYVPSLEIYIPRLGIYIFVERGKLFSRDVRKCFLEFRSSGVQEFRQMFCTCERTVV